MSQGFIQTLVVAAQTVAHELLLRFATKPKLFRNRYLSICQATSKNFGVEAPKPSLPVPAPLNKVGRANELGTDCFDFSPGRVAMRASRCRSYEKEPAKSSRPPLSQHLPKDSREGRRGRTAPSAGFAAGNSGGASGRCRQHRLVKVWGHEGLMVGRVKLLRVKRHKSSNSKASSPKW